MAHYMVLFCFTDQGMRKIKESPARVEAAKKTFQKLGADVKAFYAALGQDFDTVFLVEAANDESVAKAALAVSSGGNVRTRTIRLLSEEEFKKTVAALP